eukprot:m.156745 g.156745  ORF g.156745 m.156745 type:complete len:145 (+) comp38691_c2_seq4:1472-1906(+)
MSTQLNGPTETMVHTVIQSTFKRISLCGIGKAECGRDIIIFISHSGKTEECVQAAAHLKSLGIDILSITNNQDSPLCQMSKASIVYPLSVKEPLDILPTSSLLLQEMIVNALLRELLNRRQFSRSDFLRNHPGGSVGEKLRRDE